MRIAFFGGSFDPPHCGHLAIARAARDRLALDQVLFAPVGAQPLKRGSANASYADRLAMVRLAIAGDRGMVASTADAPRENGAPNYTLETLQALRSELRPDDELFFLLGADSFLTVRHWHRAAELLLFCNTIVAGRPGFSLEQVTAALPDGLSIARERREAAYEGFEVVGQDGESSSLYLLPDLEEDVSATEIRAALAGEAPSLGGRNVVAPAVAAYIRQHGLYSTAPLAPAHPAK